MVLSCREAVAKLQKIRQRERQFSEELARSFQNTDMSALEKYYYDFRDAIIIFSQEIEKITFFITVKNAINPFYEQLKAGGIPDQENPERKNVSCDLLKMLEEDIAIYRSRGLEHWVAALEKYQANISSCTPEQQHVIESEIKNGAVPIWMPGKETLLATTIDQFKIAFQPKWIKDGRVKPTKKAFFGGGVISQLIVDRSVALVSGVPDSPYIFFIEPTPEPKFRTRNKTVLQQHDEFKIINAERVQHGMVETQLQTIYEYAVSQIIIPKKIFAASGENNLTQLSPFDGDFNTRFINLTQQPRDVVPCANFNSAGEIGFVGERASQENPESGFRLVVRVEV